MEILIVVPVVIAATAIVMGKNRKPAAAAETVPAEPAPIPEKQSAVDQELTKRAEEDV